MKIATWNINSIKMRLPLLRNFLYQESPDILLLQEIKCETEKFPFEELSDLSYNCYVHGQKSYNGVAILSKFRGEDITTNFLSNPCREQARFIEMTCNANDGTLYRVISLYAPNGGEVDSDNFKLKLQFYDALTAYLQSIKRYDEALIVGGDFNIAPFDIDVYSPQSLQHFTCFTKIEREKIRSLLNGGFYDLYRLSNPDTQEFSWWNYQGGAYNKNEGMRLDMLLGSSLTASKLHNCSIKAEMRSAQKPSDHVPVIAF